MFTQDFQSAIKPLYNKVRMACTYSTLAHWYPASSNTIRRARGKAQETTLGWTKFSSHTERRRTI